MALKDLRRTSQKDFVNSVLQKASKKAPAKAKTVKTGGSLYEKIKGICDLVKSRLGHLADQFICISTIEDLNAYIDKCIETGFLALDTETTGLDPITDKIVGACLFTPGEKAAYVPINHISLISRNRLNNQLTEKQVKEAFQRLLDNNVKIIYFNAKFDYRVCKHQLGILLPPYWDAAIAARVLKENEEENNLKYLWTKYCSEDKNAPHFTFEKMFKGYSFDVFPIDVAYLYAANDAKITWELFKFQQPFLDPQHDTCKQCDFTRLASLFHKIEMPIITVLADIEDNGVCLDVEYCNKLSVKYHKIMDSVKDKFNQAMAPYHNQVNQYRLSNPTTKLEDPINISSPTQLAELFYDVFKCEVVNKKKPRATDEEALQKLNHPLCEPILEFRGVYKLISTYIDKMPTILNPKTKRVHCNYKQIGADTGRLACSDPNLQNIPSHNKDIRPMFLAASTAEVKGDTSVEFLFQDIITINGVDVKATDLKVGDILTSLEGHQEVITSIQELPDKVLQVNFERKQ